MLIRVLTSSQKPTQTKDNGIGWCGVLTSLSTYLTDANYSVGFLCVWEEEVVSELLMLKVVVPQPVTPPSLPFTSQIRASVFQWEDTLHCATNLHSFLLSDSRGVTDRSSVRPLCQPICQPCSVFVSCRVVELRAMKSAEPGSNWEGDIISALV